MKPPETRYPDTEMDLALLEHGPDVGFEDHGIFTMTADFSYGSLHQGLGYAIDEAFIKAFIRAFGVSYLSECRGRHIWVEHAHTGIRRLISVRGDGKEFDIQAWCTAHDKGLKQGGR